MDEVNREIETRFHKSLQVAEELYKNSLRKIADKIDTQSIYKDEKHSGKRKLHLRYVIFQVGRRRR